MLKRACICVAVLSFLIVMGLPIAQARTKLAQGGREIAPEVLTVAADLTVR
jgi:hypothetical protein